MRQTPSKRVRRLMGPIGGEDMEMSGALQGGMMTCILYSDV